MKVILVVLATFVVELVPILIAACVRRVRYQRQVKLRRELQRALYSEKRPIS